MAGISSDHDYTNECTFLLQDILYLTFYYFVYLYVLMFIYKPNDKKQQKTGNRF